MTAALMCDNCGRVTTTRNQEGETGAAEGWIAVQRNPVIVGPGLSEAEGVLSALGTSFDADDYDDETLDDMLSVMIEPPLHFCKISCLGAWASRQPDEEEATP